MTTTTLLLLTLSPALSGSAESAESLPTPTEPAPAPLQTADDTGWSGSVNLGWTQTSGNSRTREVNLDINATREIGEKHRHTIKAFLASGEQNNATSPKIKSQQTMGASYTYNYLAGEDYYYLANAGWENDKVARLNSRYWAGGGVGYEFVETEKAYYAGEAGLTYYDEDLDPPGPVESLETDFIAFRLAHKAKYEFNERTRFNQDLEFFPAIDEFRDNFLRVDSRLSTNLTDRMTGSIQYVLERDNTPAPGSRRTDHRLVVAVGWTFGS